MQPAACGLHAVSEGLTWVPQALHPGAAPPIALLLLTSESLGSPSLQLLLPVLASGGAHGLGAEGTPGSVEVPVWYSGCCLCSLAGMAGCGTQPAFMSLSVRSMHQGTVAPGHSEVGPVLFYNIMEQVFHLKIKIEVQANEQSKIFLQKEVWDLIYLQISPQIILPCGCGKLSFQCKK